MSATESIDDKFLTPKPFAPKAFKIGKIAPFCLLEGLNDTQAKIDVVMCCLETLSKEPKATREFVERIIALLEVRAPIMNALSEFYGYADVESALDEYDRRAEQE